MPALKYVQTNTLYLAGSGVIIGATSITLTTFTDIYGNVLTMSDFGGEGYITLEPDTNNEEAATFTGVTPNANGTYTLTGVKTTLAKSPYTETSGLIRQHAGGTKVVVTDNVAFWNTFTNKNNDETILGQWTFNSFPITPSNSDASTTVKGVTKLSVAPASAANPIAVGTNDNRVLVGYAVDSVGTDSYAISPSPAITAYSAGQVFTFQAGTANTGAATLNVSGLGAKTIKKTVTTDLTTGDILANQIVVVEYDGTNMQMVSTPLTVNLSSATGVLPVANGGTGISTSAYSSGVVGVTSFGSPTTIAHGLGYTPKHIKIYAYPQSASTAANAVLRSSIGTYNGTTTANINTQNTSGSTNLGVTETINIVSLTNTPSTVTTKAVATFDATNITLTWTVTNSGESVSLLWEAFGI